MGWSIGYDDHWKRDIGYGVPAFCDHPGCHEPIDRGLSYVCGGEPYGGDDGCGLYFCSRHLFIERGHPQRCERCWDGLDSFDAKPDHPRWIRHKLTDESWAEWRAENPDAVRALQSTLASSDNGAAIGAGKTD
jgi:hypothetical protein